MANRCRLCRLKYTGTPGYIERSCGVVMWSISFVRWLICWSWQIRQQIWPGPFGYKKLKSVMAIFLMRVCSSHWHVDVRNFSTPHNISDSCGYNCFGGWGLSNKVLANARLQSCSEPEFSTFFEHMTWSMEVSGDKAIHMKWLYSHSAHACECFSLGCWRDRHIVIIIWIYG